MNPVKSDRGNSGEALLPLPQTVNQTSPPQTASSLQPSGASSDPKSPSSLPDLKLIYINKPDGDLKAPSLPLGNGVGPKVVQIPNAGGTAGGFAYLGTIIKQGKDSSEGQKVLLTPVIKDGGRFILPRSGNVQRPSAGSNMSPSAGQIILSQSQQPIKSFLIHNSALGNKEIKGNKDSIAVVPKVLPPPKVPLVVCASRPPDVTLTSVKPLEAREDLTVTRQSVDVANLMSPHRDSAGLRDLPPLTPLNPSLGSTPTGTSDNDDVELVSEGDMPRPIVNKQPLKSKSTSITIVLTPSNASSSPVPNPSPVISGPIKIDDSPPPCESLSSSSADCKDDEISEKVDDCDINCKETSDRLTVNHNCVESSVGEVKEDNSIEIDQNTSDTSSEANKVVSPAQPVGCDLNVKKSKNDLANHFVRILSTCTRSDARDFSNKHNNTVFLKDGKAVVFGSLSKDIKELTVKDNKDLLAKDYKESYFKEAKENILNKDKDIEAQDENVLENSNLELSKKLETMNNTTPSLVTVPKLVPKSFPLVGSLSHLQNHLESSKLASGNSDSLQKQEDSVSPKPSFNVRSLTTIPSIITNLQVKEPGLQVKELSKENAMLERSRKRKGAPLLRDCFKKTIAVKRLEPLTGASSFEPLQVIDWDQKSRVGTLPGSDIKFVVNSYGALQVYEGEGPKNISSKPLGGMDVIYCSADSSGKDEIGKCLECECYGLLVEFIEEKFCSVNCRERNQTRKALTTKRSLALTKENTNKKRKLFEIALNKTRSTDDNEGTKPRPILPKNDKVLKSSDTKNIHKDKNDCRSDRRASHSSECADSVLPESKNKNDLMTDSTEKKSDIPQNILKGKSENLNSLKFNKSSESIKLTSKLVPLPESVKQEHASFVQLAEDKKIVKERRQSLDVGTKSTATNTVETAVERKSVDSFDWCEYLSQMRSHPAWIRLFKDAFPAQPNLFKVGYRLEAIDPQRPSLFCAVSVAHAKGYRLKLHFDGYGKSHDFWLNADSPNIFPCGFCHSHGIDLEPPWGFNKETFNWSQYLTNIKAKGAPPKCFIHKLMDTGEPNLFKVGMKLEAVDKKNSYLVCVATVAAVVDHRILVHFDSWDDSYDYWTEYYSPNIHPIGWCQRNNYILTPPNGHRKKNFSWRRYLAETGSEAAPDGAFMVRPPVKFKKGSKLEAIDPRAPHLLRVATIKQVLPYQVNVVFDGFPDHFGYWFDDDSPDLHPIGWSTRTGHPLTPPPKLIAVRHCSTAGCHGDGNASSGDLESHSNVIHCPYSMDNLEEDNLLPDRLAPRKSWNNRNQPQPDLRRDVLGQRAKKMRELIDGNEINDESGLVTPPEVVESSSTSLNGNIAINDVTSCSDRTARTNIDDSPEPEDVPLVNTVLPSPTAILAHQSNPLVKDELKVACDKFVSKSLSLPTLTSDVEAQDLLDWDSRKVTCFIESLLHRATNAFYDNKVDGEGLLMLSEDDLYKRLKFNHSEASTIYSNIVTLRTKFALHTN